jgi:PAS domain S-box-containing protein
MDAGAGPAQDRPAKFEDAKGASDPSGEDLRGRGWRSEREQYRIIFQRSPVGIFRYDRDLRITDVNDCFVKILRSGRDIMIGLDMETLKDTSILPALKAPLEGRDGYYEGPYRATYSTAAPTISMRTTPFFSEDGNPEGGIGIVEDISERVKAEEEQSRFAALVEHSNDLIGIASLEGKMLFLNRAGRKLAGLEDVKDIRELDAHHLAFPKHRSTLDGIFSGLRETGRWKGEAKIRHFKTGASIPVEMHAFAIRNPKTNEIIAFANISRDISERKAMEREMIKGQKLESIGLLAGGIAHDFNNLLSAIAGYISLIEVQVAPETEIGALLSKAGKALFRAKDLTQQLLTFSKGGNPVKKTVSIGELISDSRGLALRGANVRCDVVLSPDLRLVDVDDGQICQVFNNLLINACQAMPTGGEIHVAARNVRLAPGEIPSLPGGEYVEVSVADTGIGIAGEHLQKVFDPYFTTKQEGSGLGLATSYAILRKHDGIITVHSKLGAGAVFRVYLPASLGKDANQGPEVENRSMGKGKILVMDDEDSIRDVATAMLRALGYTAAAANDGAEALKVYDEAMKTGDPFDAVIMDLTVPGGMGGQEATAKLLQIDPNARVIVSSGYSNTGVMADYRSFGFSGVVPKPYNLKQLGEVVHRLLSLPG